MELSSLTLNFRATTGRRLFDDAKQQGPTTGTTTTTAAAAGKSAVGASDEVTNETSGALGSGSEGAKPEEESPLKIISLDEVAWHDTIHDCWLVVYDYVYDCTNFLRNHPGGQDVLLEYAGRDATLAFVGTGHSPGAKRILDKFLIGELPASERIFRTSNGIKIGEFA